MRFRAHEHAGILSFVLASLVCLLVWCVVQLGVLDASELQGYDLLVSARGFGPPPDQVVIVDFDDATVQAFNAFPIPRDLLAKVLDRTTAGNPDVVGLDILLSEKRNQVEDESLAAALARTENVILASSFASEALPAAEPLPEFRQNALEVGFVNVPLDSDGFIRRMLLWVRTEDYTGLSFPVAVASNYMKQPLQPGSSGTYRLGATEIPLDGTNPNASFIDFQSIPPAKVVPVLRLLQPDFDPAVFQGKIVLVGQSSSAAKDLYSTPLFRSPGWRTDHALMSGVEINAAAISTLLSGSSPRPLKPSLLWAINLGLIWLGIVLVIRLKPLVSTAAIFAALFGIYLVAHVLFDSHGLWMKFVSSEAGVILSVPAAWGYRFWQERRLKSLAEGARQRLEQELTLARSIQKSLLPEAPPMLDGLDIAVQHETSLLVGGDYYDFILISSDKLLLVVADVEGKGAASAMVMSNLQATLRALLPYIQEPKKIVSTLNDDILQSTRGTKLVTLFLGVLDLPSRTLAYVNAGHIPPLVLRATGQTVELRDGGMIIGLFPQVPYESGSLQLQPGDLFLACTDGITEASNAAGEQYETARILQVARSRGDHSAQQIVEAIFADVAAFSNTPTHQDDKVMIAMKVV